MEENLVPIPINELLNKQFFIPHYQRGYRWIDLQVKQLLDDIDSFNPREIDGKLGEKTFYCLQPVVVKLMNEEDKQKYQVHNLSGEWYEVIDGQQRLTTIYLIIQYINDMWAQRKKKNQFILNYETRESCVKFLQDIRINDDENTVDIDKSNIDFYHISKAYQSIRNWEKDYYLKNSKELNDGEFQSKFFAYSKIIWYKVSHDEKSQALFARLNIGKIPLTNAELTKALFLSNESFLDVPAEERKIKQFEIAKLWDQMEHKLNEPNKKFWSFITNNKRDRYDTKIELILDLISDKKDQIDEYYTFLEFAKRQKDGSLLAVWQEIEHFYYTINEWYNDKSYYHKIGYLITSRNFGTFKGVNLGQLVKDAKIKTKEAFKKQIDDLIKESVNVELSELRYEKHYNQLFNVLLLFNVETNRASDAISEFYPFKQHKDNVWSLEHIHARRSENFEQTKREPWLKWLELHKNLLEEMSEQTTIIEKINSYHNEQLTWERFSNLFNEINNILTSDTESMDRDSEGIRNLALLSQPDNAALNNSVFEVKRREIIKMDKKGSFIPVCTRRAFMKYFNEEGLNTQNYFWSEKDRESYIKVIEKTLENYLSTNSIEDDTDDNE